MACPKWLQPQPIQNCPLQGRRLCAALHTHSHFTLTQRHTLWPRACSSFGQEALPLLLPALATPWLAGSGMRN